MSLYQFLEIVLHIAVNKVKGILKTNLKATRILTLQSSKKILESYCKSYPITNCKQTDNSIVLQGTILISNSQ